LLWGLYTINPKEVPAKNLPLSPNSKELREKSTFVSSEELLILEIL